MNKDKEEVITMFKITLGLQNGMVNCLLETKNDVASYELQPRLKEMLEAIQSINEVNAARTLPIINRALPIPLSDNTNLWDSASFLGKDNLHKPATEKQISYMEKICQEQNLDPDEVAKEHGVSSVEQMSSKACWKFIKQHKKD